MIMRDAMPCHVIMDFSGMDCSGEIPLLQWTNVEMSVEMNVTIIDDCLIGKHFGVLQIVWPPEDCQAPWLVLIDHLKPFTISAAAAAAAWSGVEFDLMLLRSKPKR